MNFDPYDHPLKISESIRTPTPKVGVHLGVWSSFFHTFYILGNMKCDSWASLLAHTFTSPCLGCEPKTKVATLALGYETNMNVIVSPSAWFSMCKWCKCLRRHENKIQVAKNGI
jgi:hypothetical protein